MNELNNIPDASDVPAASGGKTWRFSEGRIVTGRTEDGTLQTRSDVTGANVDSIVGRLVRVGIHEGKVKDYDRPYAQVEADIETKDGVVYVKANLLDQETFALKPSRSTLDFAWGLLQMKAGDIFRITAAQGESWTDEKGRKMKPSTYVNWELLEPVVKDGATTWNPKRLIKPKADPNNRRSMVDQWREEMDPQIRAHELFAPRPSNREDDEHGNATTHLSALCKEMTEKGWPTPEQNPGGWLGLCAKYFKEEKPRAALSDYDDDAWGEIRLQMQKLEQCPQSIKPADRGELV